MPNKNMTFPKLVEQFGSEDACHEALAELRWPDGVVTCLRCSSEKISRIVKRRQYECDACGYQFSVRVGTIFQESRLPLWKWFLAIYMMCESKKGVSANQLKRMLGVTYKTAWFLCHRIRHAMRDEDQEPLDGAVIEIDETFVGGVKRGMKQGYKGNKALVIAAVERGGEMRAKVIPNQGAKAIRGFIAKNVDEEAPTVYTDELAAYQGTGTAKRVHATVTHSRNEWVNGQVHTNTVEGVHSLLKRSIIGSYHKISKKHLPAYIDEMEWRYNNRKNPYLFRDTLMEMLRSEHLEYRQLVEA